MGEAIRKERPLGAAPKVTVRKSDGTKSSDTSLDPAIFAVTPNVPLMHQVVNAQLAAARSGTQSTKTRAEVEGGSAKPWRQKGTGRARQGSTRAPHFAGGGVALGPKPRSYKQKTPKKMVQLALRSALSDRASEGKVVVVDAFDFESPKTKSARNFLKACDIEGRALIVLGDDDERAFLSFRNLQEVHVVHQSELNTFDVLRHDFIVFTKETLPSGPSETTAVAAPTRTRPESTESTPAASDSAEEGTVN